MPRRGMKDLRLNIRCAVCGGRVERWSMERDDYRMSIVIRVDCHGAVDRMELPFQFIRSISADELDALIRSEGVAFQHSLLEKVDRLPAPEEAAS